MIYRNNIAQLSYILITCALILSTKNFSIVLFFEFPKFLCIVFGNGWIIKITYDIILGILLFLILFYWIFQNHQWFDLFLFILFDLQFWHLIFWVVVQPLKQVLVLQLR